MTRALNVLTVMLFIAALMTRNPYLFLAAILLALVAGFSVLWDRYALAAVSYTRRLGATHVFVGDETDLTIEIVNAKPLPLAWLRVEDEAPGEIDLVRGRLIHSYKPGRRVLPVLTSLRFYERVRKHYRLRAKQRGAVEFGPAEMQSGDMFGFRYQREMLEQRDWLIIYPKVVPVSALGLPAAHPFGDERTLRKIAEDPLRITGVRPYVPGDSPRMVHWKATARRGELQTKVFDPSASHTSAIFLDLRTIQDFPGIVPEYLELAICAAASVARRLLDEREAVGLYANGARRTQIDLVHLPPSRRPAQWTEILETCAWLSGIASTPLARVVRAEMSTLPFGAMVIAISAVVSDDLLAALLDLRRASHPVLLLAIGESTPEGVPDRLPMFWIGGSEAWHELKEFDFEAGLAGESGGVGESGNGRVEDSPIR